ncbi:hypothetical protein OAL35_00935 [bacterium]|nr:hypothetical protein [bacterium]
MEGSIEDQVEPDLQNQPHRDRQARRKRYLPFAAIASVIALVVAAPSLLSHTSIGISLFNRLVSNESMTSEIHSFRVGWVTPFEVNNLRLSGNSGSQINIAKITTDLSIIGWLLKDSDEPSHLYIRDTDLQTQFKGTRFNLEEEWLNAKSSEHSTTDFHYVIHLENLNAEVTDAASNATWSLQQANVEICVSALSIETEFSGVLTDPNQRNGSLQGTCDYRFDTEDRLKTENATIDRWLLVLNCDSLPLSVGTLGAKRYLAPTDQFATTLTGDATGGISIACDRLDQIRVNFDQLETRQISAKLGKETIWNTQLATLNGEVQIDEQRITSQNLNLSTDFGNASANGSFTRSFSFITLSSNPSQWLNQLDGHVDLHLDLAKLRTSLPKAIPFREEIDLTQGQIFATLDTTKSENRTESELTVNVSEILARSNDELISIAPNQLIATLIGSQDALRADKLQLETSFGTAIGQGDLHSGSAEVKLDFGQLMSSLNAIVELPNCVLGGVAQGSIEWQATQEREWTLRGIVEADHLAVTLPSILEINEEKIKGSIQVTGQWNGNEIQQLDSLDLEVLSDQFSISGELVQPTQSSNKDQHLSMRWVSTGNLSSWNKYIPEAYLSKHSTPKIGGQYQLRCETDWSSAQMIVSDFFLEAADFSILHKDHLIRQPRIQVQLAGKCLTNQIHWVLDDLTLSSNSFSLRANGQHQKGNSEYQIQWRTILDRLIESHTLVGNDKESASAPGQEIKGKQELKTELTSFSAILGNVEGTLIGKQLNGRAQYEVDVSIKDFAARSFETNTLNSDLVGPLPANSFSNQSMVWVEPEIRFLGVAQHRTSNCLQVDRLQLSTSWLTANVKGVINENPSETELVLEGTTNWKMDKLATQIKNHFDFDLDLAGLHENEIQLEASHSPEQGIELEIDTGIGWESGGLGGIEFGSATIPLEINERQAKFDTDKIAVGDGTIAVAGTAYFPSSGTWIQLNPGVIAEGIKISPRMSEQWLQFIAPLLADATEIDGNLGIEIDDAVIHPNDLIRSQVRGRLQLGEVRLLAGPIANQLLASVDQVKTFRDLSSFQPAKVTQSTLVNMPAQTIDFSLHQGLVSHERLFFEIDRAMVITSGQVNLAGNLNLTAMIPLDARWLGRDLERLAGQTLTLPIRGTLNRPQLDSTQLGSIITQVGTNALQQNAESYLEEQLSRGIDRLFGK